MLRRDFVRTLLSAVFAPRLLRAQQTGNSTPPPAPEPWTLGLNPKTPLPQTVVAAEVAEAGTKFFTLQQMRTLARLSDVLVPPVKGKPGALEGETPQFMDVLIGNSPAPRKKLYTTGLDWLEAESEKKFKLPFAKLDTEQAGSLLDPWLRPWMSDHPPTESHAEFINVAHAEIREATVNSRAWSVVPSQVGEESTATALYWSPIEPAERAVGPGCLPLSAGVLGAPRSGHSMPEYPR
jgi:Gluconate 2-dehydrogenase subunit 3